MQRDTFQELFTNIASLASETTFDDFFRQVGEFLVDFLNADIATVLHQQVDGMLRYRSIHGVPPGADDAVLAKKFEPDSLIAWEALKHGQPLFVREYADHPNSNPMFRAIGLRSALVMPVVLRQADLHVAVSVAWRRSVEEPSQDEVNALRAVCNMVASSLYRELLEIERDSVVRLNGILLHVNQAMVRLRTKQALFQEVCDIAVTAGGMRMAWIGEPDARGQYLLPVAVAGFDQGYTDAQRVALDARSVEGLGPSGRAFRTGQLQFAGDVAEDPAMAPWRASALERGFRSSVAIPVLTDERTVGVLSIYADRPNVFAEQERRVLTEIGHDLSFALAYMRESHRLRRTRAQLAWEATHDALTGLPNRTMLLDRIRHALAQADRQDNCLVVVLVVDLDGFKDVNDRLGHINGDMLLRRVARRFQSQLRDADTVARLGGDEFVVVLERITVMNEVEAAINRVKAAVMQPIDLDSERVEVSLSIGAAIYPFDTDASGNSSVLAETLLTRADMAMYQAKASGRNCHRLYDAALEQAVREKHELRSRVESSLIRDALTIHYQPKVDMCTGEVLGAEALVRFIGDQGEIELPGPFINAVMSTRFMTSLDQWVLENVFAQIATWAEDGEPTPVSVNLSREYLKQTRCVKQLGSLLKRYPQTVGLIQLEILETFNADDLTALLPTLYQLSGMGLQLTLDDFGTGASALVHLQQVPAQEIKIDQGFVRQLPDQPENEAIIKALLAFADHVPRRVVAEGVESISLGRHLQRLGCRYGQGYAIAKPMPANHLPIWKHSWVPPTEWRDAPAAVDLLPNQGLGAAGDGEHAAD